MERIAGKLIRSLTELRDDLRKPNRDELLRTKYKLRIVHNDSPPQAAVPFIRAGTDSTGGAGGAV